MGKRSIIGVIDFTPSAGCLAEACVSFKIPYLGFAQTPTAERVTRRYLFKRTWDFMCKPGSPHYEAAIRDLIVKETTGDKTNETGEQGEKTTGGGQGEHEKAIVGGAGRAKKKDSDSEKNTGGEKETSSKTKKPKTGEVNPELFKALKALEVPVGISRTKDEDEADKDESDSVSNAED